ncbi:MAG: SMI1/KNR4 family protein [Candidatus Woesearchaeota archaeon]
MLKIINFIVENLKKVDVIGDVDEETIKDAEGKLGISFPSQLREIIKNFGCISYKQWELFGLGVKESSHLNIVKNTLELREYKLPETYIPFISFDDGAYAVVDSNNSVYEFVINSSNVKKIDDNLDDFLYNLFSSE